MIKIVVIGTGNVGMHVCHALENQKLNRFVSLTGYYNQSQIKLKEIDAPLISNITNLPDCDLILLAVPDDMVATVSEKLEAKDAIVAHTSGSVPLSALKKHLNFGVFYMPQTFSKSRAPNFGEITICLESSSETVHEVLENVAVTLSRKREQINSLQRKNLHLAAVYMNNFVNHCYTKAEEIMKDAAIDTHLLDALMRETLEKAIEISPKNAQTGPAIRNDLKTIQRHLKMLNKEDQKMYQSITESIKKTYGNKL